MIRKLVTIRAVEKVIGKTQAEAGLFAPPTDPIGIVRQLQRIPWPGGVAVQAQAILFAARQIAALTCRHGPKLAAGETLQGMPCFDCLLWARGAVGSLVASQLAAYDNPVSPRKDIPSHARKVPKGTKTSRQTSRRSPRKSSPKSSRRS